MQDPTPFSPSTPGPSTRLYPSLSVQTHQPVHSSPLAESPCSSPVLSSQRRRSSYKATFAPISAFKYAPGKAHTIPEDPQKAFLRERFKTRCIERARQDREKALRRVSRRRSVDGSISGGSSDGDADADMDSEGEDEDEDEENLMSGELFKRIMDNTERKTKHSYRVSYAHEVGSSFDPSMEDPTTWENELQDIPQPLELNTSPEDLEAEELQAYADEYAALADFEDIPEEEWDLSDLDEATSTPTAHAPRTSNEAMEMEMDTS
ncbi:hypothetical protein FIBSPDRAFT_807695 [Athelia psychrophila]|uniref:Uncharacterized protein n=1 Tax=Athelia psychrophila TaxID=1759441 RepID=A0A167U3B8_9AGAM|nr:hypothetical protein FIBSPDRAFT_807695 [Fibularhizoctonia sp. CBS 109695]